MKLLLHRDLQPFASWVWQMMMLELIPNGGAIALGHPLGMSGARLITTALVELEEQQKRYALCTMCIGVGQGIAMVIERTCEHD
jgi:acetyl-CoA acetyltransferase